MRFLADENFPLDAVESLRDAGHDVAWVRTDSPGSSDPQILERVIDECRVLLTFDKDFGELAFHSQLPSECGIVLFRLPMTSAADIARSVGAAIASGHEWAGHFATVGPGPDQSSAAAYRRSSRPTVDLRRLREPRL